MAFEPEGIVEKAGDALGLVERRVQGDLERFKSFIESRVLPTGEWRGEVHGGVVTNAGSAQAVEAPADGSISSIQDRPL
jgi:hypothetical protein